MTKGKIVNKQTGLEIPAEKNEEYLSYFWATIEGDKGAMFWYSDVWDFIEDKPSAYEQFLSFKPGQRFTIGDDVVRIKLDGSTYAGYKAEWDSWSTFHGVGPTWFNKSDTLEVIDD